MAEHRPRFARNSMAIATTKNVPPAGTTRVGGEAGPVQAVSELTKEQELAGFRDMLLIRRFEEKAGQMYGMGRLGGFCHLYIGHEPVVVGLQLCMKPRDEVIAG